jgi:hypothetical protein
MSVPRYLELVCTSTILSAILFTRKFRHERSLALLPGLKVTTYTYMNVLFGRWDLERRVLYQLDATLAGGTKHYTTVVELSLGS